jgi:YidC/Oxa1 family membrane protein insertase
MTDMRRTLLWVVFTMSLVLIWDAWNKHTGQASMFGGNPKASRPPRRRPQPANAAQSAAAGVPAPAAVPTRPASRAGACFGVPHRRRAAQRSER